MADLSTPTEERSATREAILSAGVMLVGERGFDGPTVSDICSQAKVTEEVFYQHFRSRDDLIAAAFERVARAFLSAIIAPGDRAGDLAVTVRRFVNAMASGVYQLTGDKGVRPHELIAACDRSPEFRERFLPLVRECLDRLERVAQAAQQGSRLRSEISPEHVAVIFTACVIGVQTMMEWGVPLDPSRLATSMLHLVES